ncbi:MAG: hypothetical protein KOO66_00985 [Bacteroidales bacterium]|nr:hypothetical protein [Bacteroidales bacterium]
MKTIKKIMFGIVWTAFIVISVNAQPKSEIIDDKETKINWAEADTLYTFQFNTQSNSWVFFQREIRRFNEKNLPTENFVQNRDNINQNWVNYLKVNYTYDERGFEIEEIKQEWNQSYNNWINANLKTITYKGRKIEEILFQEWKKPTNEWYNIIKYLIKYNDKGVENAITVSLYNGITKTWDNHKRFKMEFDFIYSPPTKVVSETWLNENWKTEGMYELEYNSRGYKTMETRYTWQRPGIWIEGIKIEIIYDKKGNQLEYNEMRFDSNNNDWTRFNKNEALYNEDGYMTEKIEYTWNRNTSQWDVKGKYRFTTETKI